MDRNCEPVGVFCKSGRRGGPGKAGLCRPPPLFSPRHPLAAFESPPPHRESRRILRHAPDTHDEIRRSDSNRIRPVALIAPRESFPPPQPTPLRRVPSNTAPPPPSLPCRPASPFSLSPPRP